MSLIYRTCLKYWWEITPSMQGHKTALGYLAIYVRSQYIFTFSLFMFDQFIMANGGLVRTLIHTDVTKYLSFKAVDGSYVFNKGKVISDPLSNVNPLLY